MSRETCDLAILGGGCAGLALATHLAEGAGGGLDTLLLEGRSDYQADRTWCYWAVDDHPFRALETHRWSRWKLRLGGREIECRSERYPYALLPSHAYYESCQRRIRQGQGVELRLAAQIEALRRTESHWQIGLKDMPPLRARRLADSRPLPVASGTGLLQHFVGQYLHLDQPSFDPEVVTLMDFDLDQSRGIHFIYLLPLAANRVYVADTYLSHRPLPTQVYRDQIRAWLGQRHGVDRFELEREEIGVIPMHLSTPPRRLGPAHFALGGRGGAIRASSGYAFTAIQRQVQSWLELEPSGDWLNRPPPAARGPVLRWLDAMLLCHMLDHPEQLPAVFFGLFQGCEADALVRFLSDCPTAADIAQVLRASPGLALGRTALRRLPRWLGA